jgi:hypothetical protein
MNKLKKRLEDIMVAITFAEAGEYDEASRLASDAQDDKGTQMEGLKKPAVENAGK